MAKFGDDVKQLRINLYNRIADTVETFKMETGVSPSAILVEMIEVQPLGTSGREYLVDRIKLKFDL